MRKECFVIGGGSSLSSFNWNSLTYKDTIVSNAAIFYVPKPKYFVTVDYTFYTKLNETDRDIFDNIGTTKIFIADMSEGTPLIEENGRILDPRWNLVYKLNPYDMVVKAKYKQGFSYEFSQFCTGINSGYCALQTAIALGYKKIYLLGIDLNAPTETHFHNKYKNKEATDFRSKLDRYYNYFESGLRQLKQENQVEVINCSESSRLANLIPTVSLETVLKDLL